MGRRRGGDRDRRVVAVQIGFATARQRLLQQRDTMSVERVNQGVELIAGVALIGIHAEPHVRPGGANGSDALNVEIEIASQLDLNCLRARVAARGEPPPRRPPLR